MHYAKHAQRGFHARSGSSGLLLLTWLQADLFAVQGSENMTARWKRAGKYCARCVPKAGGGPALRTQESQTVKAALGNNEAMERGGRAWNQEGK